MTKDELQSAKVELADSLHNALVNEFFGVTDFPSIIEWGDGLELRWAAPNGFYEKIDVTVDDNLAIVYSVPAMCNREKRLERVLSALDRVGVDFYEGNVG